MAFWSTKAVPMVDSNARKQHIPIMAPLRAVSLDQIPTAGAVALLPTDTPLAKAAMEYMQNSLSEVPDVQIQRGEAEVDENTRAIVWLDGSPGQIQLLDDLLAKYERIGWVQLPMAGINAYSSLLKKYPTKIWTSAKGAFSQPVAEHAFTLALALLRYLPMRIRATSWGYSQAMSLFNSNILILGAGGITLSLIAQLEPFSPTITILRRKAEPLEDEVVPAKLKERISVSTLNDLDKHLPQADIVFVACAMTPDTRGCFAKSQFDKMQKHSILVNVARGEILNTDDLISALREGQIGGAGLDVTDPEPLPDGHPLWTLTTKHENMNVEEEKGGKRANLIITPHTADTIEQIVPLFAQRIARNAEAFVLGNGRFEGLCDTEAGY